MKKKSIIIIILVIFVLMASCVLINFLIPPKNEQKPTLGVWWWNNKLDSTYLDFAEENNVTEIYYCDSNFNNDTRYFIKSANEKGIKVYLLAGEYEWIEDSTNLIYLIDNLIAFNNSGTSNFAGIHLDIEPHQHSEFNTRRLELITKFVDLTLMLKNSYPNLWIEYDIPFWLEDEVTSNNITKPAYQHIIDNASRVTLMSYRDTSEAIYNVSKEELEYAKSIDKPINLGVETKSSEGDNVSFMEEGKKVMMEELSKLREKIDESVGIVIHHIYTWFNLKD